MKSGYCFFILMLMLFLFFSCNESDIGIFYGLETEKKITDNSLPNEVTVGGMFKNGGELYIAAGRVYTKTSGSDADWVKLPSPSGYDLSTSIAADGTLVYAVFYDKNSADKALFTMANGGSWSRETASTASINGSIEFVKNSDDGEIFLSTRINSQEGGLYHLNGTFQPVAGLSLTGSVFHVLHDGTDYWISNYNKLYKGADINSMGEVVELDITEEIQGLSVSFPNDFIYFTYYDKDRRRSYLVSTDGNGTYNESGSIYYRLNGLNIFEESGYRFLLAGTSGRGYYQILSPSATKLDLKKPENNILAQNYNSAVDLQTSVVLDIFVDGTDFYALTATEGLWKNSLSGGSRVWSIE